MQQCLKTYLKIWKTRTKNYNLNVKNAVTCMNSGGLQGNLM